jgi:hypothetical protein
MEHNHDHHTIDLAMEEVITAFHSFLTRNLIEARRAHLGKTVRLNVKSGCESQE